jgi:probable F420-dependent oxidoreductase
LATPENLMRVAVAAEGLGFFEVSIGEHLMYPRGEHTPHPYTPGGHLPFPADHINVDIVAALAYVAACTSRIRLRSGVLILPYTNPFQVAKQVATVDLLSHGRFALGVGAGWMREEFDVLRVPFEKRGAITDESIDVIKALWRGDDFPDGAYFSYTGMQLAVRPTQAQPPILIGGISPAAMRRVAQRGDGWITIGLDAAGTRTRREGLARLFAERGRDVAALEIIGSIDIGWGAGPPPPHRWGAVKADPTPSTSQLVAAVEAWRDAGATGLAVGLGTFHLEIDRWIARMEWFAEHVMPRIGTPA